MRYLVLLAKLSWQLSAVPNPRQCHGDWRISNFLDEGGGVLTRQKEAQEEALAPGDDTRQGLGGKY